MASDGAAQTDSAPVPPSWAANHFKQTKGDRGITFVQSRLIHKMTSILVPVGFRKYSIRPRLYGEKLSRARGSPSQPSQLNSEHSTIYSGNMILLDRVLTLTH